MEMETETPLVADTFALTEKKVAMALDELIKLNKKGKKLWRQKKRNQNFNAAAKNHTPSHHMNSLSAVRQGAVAKKWSKFQGNQFPVTTNIARKAAAAAPLGFRRRAFNAGRITSANQSRLISRPVENLSVHTKRHELTHQKAENRAEKKKTLDSRFASMKEQRKSNSKNNNNYGGSVQVRRLPPWARARIFPN